MTSFFSRSFPTTLDRDKKAAATIKPAKTIRICNNFIFCKNVSSHKKMIKCHKRAKDMRGKTTSFSFEAPNVPFSVASSLPFYNFLVQNRTCGLVQVQSCLLSCFLPLNSGSLCPLCVITKFV